MSCHVRLAAGVIRIFTIDNIQYYFGCLSVCSFIWLQLLLMINDMYNGVVING